MRKNKSKKSNKLFYMLAFFMILSLLISNMLVKHSFEFGGYSILMSVFVYPFVFFFANLITKHYNPSKTTIAIFLAIIAQGLYFLVANQIGNIIPIWTVLGSIIAFGLSQIVNLFLYSKILNKKKIKVNNIFLIYTVSLFIDNIVFFLIMSENYNLGFIYAMIFRLIIAFTLSLAEIKFLTKSK